MFALILFLAFLLPFIHATEPKSRTVNPDLNARLKLAATNFDRQALLTKDSDWWYDFDNHPNYNSAVGAVITADAASFPALTNLGISIALLKLAPCGMLPPHFHPRATNLVTAITGNTTSWMIGENGVKTIRVNLTPMRMTIFPQGSLHVMQNNDCEPALLLSALNSDDSGTDNIMPSLWTVPQDIIRAGLGNPTINTEDLGKDIPKVGTGAIMGSAECQQRCGILHGKE
ncbi:RmlC-like cupin [Cucurbitaria berberidis CBS 394.84]|uniref:RmlC-like cupin n=1 Tax=Cucurbitaria berberidis CBS 394.84 TaxID=1168544 RepID=A0A9P4LBM9_9PLEO|nr:RmlC-like cupin [Cucurbitaria berberidis CBS 394.84]KAF1848344.1 RmlC-like cupin [Cucurbitaria berberidis CBS 394.84]